ncbi:MAG: hypothetical protein D3923_18425, partial [Candidatus Electrothrix sp. AR3]|nr:hypothetical protein [Candidatus Electrothrix sp. AR3]
MKAHKPTLTVLLLLAILFPSVSSFSQHTESKSRINISRLQEEIALQEEKIDQSEAQELTVLDELASINTVIEQQQEKIAVFQKQLHSQQLVLAVIQQDLQQTEDTRDKAMRHMLNRLRSFYMMGKLGVLNVTFSNKDLPDLLLCTDAFHQVMAYDRTAIDQYRGAVAELEKSKFTQELEESLLEELVRQAEEEKEVLDNLRIDREELLARINTQQGLYKLAIQEMRQAEQDLKESLNQFKRPRKRSKKGGIQRV